MEQNGTEKGYGARCEDNVIVTRKTDLQLLIYQSFLLFLALSQSYSFRWETFDSFSAEEQQHLKGQKHMNMIRHSPNS